MNGAGGGCRSPIRVMLVDDQHLVRSGLAMLLASQPDIEVVGECGDGSAALQLAEELQPDVVVMDVRMPGMDGVEATRHLARLSERSADPDVLVRVLVVTTFSDDDVVLGALRAGASGLLLKDAAPDELVAAVHALARGDAWLDPTVTGGLLHEFARRPDSGGPAPEELARLTAREREVLVLVSHGLSNAEIAARLTVGEATVKTHVGRVLMKLGLRDRAQAVAVAYRSGLVKP